MDNQPDFAAVKERQRALWKMGDYAAVARVFEPSSAVLVEEAGVAAGQDVLDVATGTGNVALAAARLGANVTASDLTPDLLAIAQGRAAEEGLELAWGEADVEALPYADDAFDVVMSSFGAMFAPRPELAISELFRVLRPGGTLGLLSWTPEGANGAIFKVMSQRLPQQPGAPQPTRWGDREFMRELLAPYTGRVEFSNGFVVWRFASWEEGREFQVRTAPPAAILKRSLPPEQFDEVFAQIERLQAPFNSATDGSVAIDTEYLVTIARA